MDSNPFTNDGGICECIKSTDPFPGEQPVPYALGNFEIEDTYGSIDEIASGIENYGLHLQESNSKAGGGKAGGGASANAGGGSASASSGKSSSHAGGAAGSSTSSTSGGKYGTASKAGSSIGKANLAEIAADS